MGAVDVALLASAVNDMGNLVMSSGLRSCFRGVYCYQPLTGIDPRPVHRVVYREIVHRSQEDLLRDAEPSRSSCIFSHALTAVSLLPILALSLSHISPNHVWHQISRKAGRA